MGGRDDNLLKLYELRVESEPSGYFILHFLPGLMTRSASHLQWRSPKRWAVEYGTSNM